MDSGNKDIELYNIYTGDGKNKVDLCNNYTGGGFSMRMVELMMLVNTYEVDDANCSMVMMIGNLIVEMIKMKVILMM